MYRLICNLQLYSINIHRNKGAGMNALCKRLSGEDGGTNMVVKAHGKAGVPAAPEVLGLITVQCLSLVS